MGKKARLQALIFFIIFLAGCVTPSISDRDIVLIDSEIPWKMSEGQYVSHDGETFIVSEENPRWSVSEAWIFDSYKNMGSQSFNANVIFIILGAAFFLLLCYRIFLK